MSTPTSARDDGLFPASPAEPAIPSGIDRRSFLMRNAAIGAAAVMTGTNWTPEARAAQAAKESVQRNTGLALAKASSISPDLDVVKKSKRPVMDHSGRVLQGRPRPFEFAHGRADAHHLRLLPAVREAAA